MRETVEVTLKVRVFKDKVPHLIDELNFSLNGLVMRDVVDDTNDDGWSWLPVRMNDA